MERQQGQSLLVLLLWVNLGTTTIQPPSSMRKPSKVDYQIKTNTAVMWGMLLVLTACTPDESAPGMDYPSWDGQTLFEPVTPASTGVDFANTLAYEEEFNIYKYRNFYNGGGVAIGAV